MASSPFGEGMFGNISRVMAAAPQVGEATSRLYAPNAGLARMGRSLPGGASPVDINDPASLRAEAQRLMNAGDFEQAKAYQNQALQLEQARRAQSGEGRAVRNEDRTVSKEMKEERAKIKAAREKVQAKHAKNDEELSELQNRSALLKEAGQRGYGDLVRASRGMSNADISAELLRRSKEGRDAAQDAAPDPMVGVQIETLKQIKEQYADDEQVQRVIDAQLHRVAAGGKFDTAMTAITSALKEKVPAVGDMATPDETIQISDTAASIEPDVFGQLDDADKFRVATIIKNRQRNNPNVPIDTLIKQLATEYSVEGGDSPYLLDAFEADILNRKALSDEELLGRY